jgi:hypothetical protein
VLCVFHVFIGEIDRGEQSQNTKKGTESTKTHENMPKTVSENFMKNENTEIS